MCTAATLVLLTGVAASAAAQPSATLLVTVRNAVTGAPVADATIVVVSGRRTCITAGDGRCRVVASVGETDVRATAIGFAPAAQAVSLSRAATAEVAFALTPSARPLDRVVTVGTRAYERTVSQSPVPVDVISSQLLEGTGVPEPWQQLQRLVPSVNVPHIPIGDNHMRPVTLRGLAPHHVLVLVNGKRRHPAAALLAGPAVPFTAFTDIGAIPSGAIERIEVMRDGAAAQYGSDAIGGVVNIVTHAGERRELRVSAGQALTSEGGREFRDGRLINVSGTFGHAASSGRHITMSADVRDRDGTNRAYPDQREQYFTGDSRNDAPPRVSSYNGNGAVRSVLTFVSAGVPISGDTEAYATGGLALRAGRTPDAFFRRPRDLRTVRAIHPDGFLPLIESDIRDLTAVTGVRGSLHGWRWDVGSGWGGNRIAYMVRNSNNASLGADSPTDFDAGAVATQQWTANADIARELRIASLPVNVAGGVEVRVERYRIAAGEPDSWRDGEVRILDGPAMGRRAEVGAQGMPGFRPADEVSAQRTSAAVYVEGELRPMSRLLLQSAGRFERYSDFGTTTDGKLAAHMALVRGIAVRGSAGTGFRAPALSQEYFSSTRTVFRPEGGTNAVLAVRTFPVHTAEAQLMGATPLKPEQSVNVGLGLVLEVPRLPLLSADLYQIEIDDRIGLTGSVRDSSIVRFFEERGMYGIGGGNYFSNALDIRTRGIDLVASHAFLIGRAGTLRLLGGYNHTRNVVVRRRPLPPELAPFQSALSGGRTGRGVLENGQPRQTMTTTLDFESGPWGLALHNRRAGPTAQLDNTDPESDQIVRAKWITDARVSYRVHPRLHATLSAANLFDVYPDEWWDFRQGLEVMGPSGQGNFRYPGGLSTFGMNGRTVYVQLTYR